MEPSSTYLTAGQVKQRYGGRSDMWLFRAVRDDVDFPKPMKLRGQRYWRLNALVAWEEAQLAQTAASEAAA